MGKIRNAVIITPVKDSLATTLETITSVRSAHPDIRYIVYNDYSSVETQQALENNKNKFHFELINLSDLIQKPSPNYDVILSDAQRKALQAEDHLIITESDVSVKEKTIDDMIRFANENEGIGLAGAVTVDENGEINFPYLKFKNKKGEIVYTRRSLSFCCTLLSYDFLKAFSFDQLDPSKDWYDVAISKKSLELGFRNVLLKGTPVLHRPHSSRPWKLLKYKSPLKYYFYKWTKGRDKI